MKRRILALVMAFALVFSLSGITASAAGDIVWTQDTTLQNFINAYNNATVKAGVTLTMREFKPDPQGLEIAGSLTVEPGGRITGPGSIIFYRGAVCTGLELYYIAGGEEKLIKLTLPEFAAKAFPNIPDYRPTFVFNSATGHFVLYGNSFEGDPFADPADIPPADGGTGEYIPDERTLSLAEGLKILGLFMGKGTNEDGSTNFDLGSSPSRVEAVVMLIRLLGKENEALSGSHDHPFDDVPTWADAYIGYAYENELAAGIGNGKFGTGEATAKMFATFVLRAMGYMDDTKGGSDFTYEGALDFAERNGLISGEGDIEGFNRGSCVRIMESALRQSTKEGERLYEKLVSEGVFTEEAYRAAF